MSTLTHRSMNLLLVAPDFENRELWSEAFLRLTPPVRLVAEGDIPDHEVAAVLVDSAPPLRLRRFPNLQVVFSLTAGVDTLLADPDLPDVPIVRLVPADTAALMKEYVVYQALRLHRGFANFERLQREHRWVWPAPSVSAASRRLSVLGLGQVGMSVAEGLRDVGFQVAGWTRTPKDAPGIRCITGDAGLAALLSDTDILVSVLPLTRSTRGLLCKDLFQRLPRGASIINVGRGGCLDEVDLLEALGSGHIAHATLDVFAREPLQPESLLWDHPRVTITPHAAGYPAPQSMAALVAANVARLTNGEAPLLAVDRARGY